MKTSLRLAFATLLSPSAAASALAAPPASIPSPSEFLGFEVGADKKLADYRQIAKYFQALKAASPRVDIEVLGKTTLGEDMFMAVISSEENIKNAKRIREIAKRLADPRGLSNAEAERLEALARKTGRTKSHYAKLAIVEFLEDQEDYLLAIARLEKNLPGIPIEEVERRLGLGD